MNRSIFKLILTLALIGLLACSSKKPVEDKTEFSEIDSLTDAYLTLQDSVVNTWNFILADENEKLKSLHELLHTLMATEQQDQTQLIELEQRLDNLEEIRFTRDNLTEDHVVEEYDFASNSLVSEIVSEAESRADFPGNHELQKLADRIKIAEARITILRTDYDSAASRFNAFLDRYQSELTRLDESLPRKKVPLF